MNPHYPGYTPFPTSSDTVDRARVPGIAGPCSAVALLIASALVFQVGAVLVFGLPALILNSTSFRRQGNRPWAGLAFVVIMATPVVSAFIDYVAIIDQYE